MPRCRICKTKFEARFFNQKTCENPKCIIAYKNHLKAKNWIKEKRFIKENLKTNSEHKKELQVIFNKFIRLRDKNKPCISCLKPLKTKYDAGHYRSSGGNQELRFEELNVHAQCVHCNQYLHGNLINYRINLIKRIGLDKVEWLESHHEAKHYSISELKELKLYYKQKIKINQKN